MRGGRATALPRRSESGPSRAATSLAGLGGAFVSPSDADVLMSSRLNGTVAGEDRDLGAQIVGLYIEQGPAAIGNVLAEVSGFGY